MNVKDFKEALHLAHHIATEAAYELIMSESVTEEIDKVAWCGLGTEAIAGKLPCEDEVRYLKLRGMLEHHPTRPNLVRIVGND